MGILHSLRHVVRTTRSFLRLGGWVIAVAACQAPDSGRPAEEVLSRDVPVDLGEAVAEAYRERLRLGLGNPFRLAELVLQDPRLEGGDRLQLAHDLVHATAAGEGYLVLPASLISPTRPFTVREAEVAGNHLRLINATVDQARDPGAGEAAVRIAYRLALAEHTVDASQYFAAVYAAALRRDRRLARADAQDLLDAARASGAEVTELLPHWRRQRRFAVERPPLALRSNRSDLEAMQQLDALLASIRLISLRTPAPAGGDPRTESLLSTLGAERLQALPDSFSTPPRAAVAVAANTVGMEMQLEEHVGWRNLLPQLVDEERLVAHWTLRDTLAPPVRHALSRTLLRSAVGLRALAQENPWVPTAAAPTVEELRARYGLRIVTDSGVPTGWIPFYLSALDAGLEDLQAVVPRLNVLGLTIRITRASSIPGALASHTGTTRTLEWPVVTGPGVLAHEIGHDLDRQAALRAGRRGYASDAAAGTASSFAQALAALSPTVPERAGGSPATSPAPRVDHATRPAELFARSFEWFVVSRLAARGRSNGFLSSAIDDVLTGHGSLRPPGFSRAFGSAIITALRSVVQLPPAETEGFLAAYGPARSPTATSIVRAILDSETVGPLGVGEPVGPTLRLEGLNQARDDVLAELTTWMCNQGAPLADLPLVEGYRRLARKAAAARARGMALEVASQTGGMEALRWMRRELYGPMWPPSSGSPEQEILRPLLLELAEASSSTEAPLRSWSGFLPDPQCPRPDRSDLFSIFSAPR